MHMSLNCIENIVLYFNTKLHLHKYLYKRPLHFKTYECEKYKLKQFSELDHPAKPRWPLDQNAVFLKGAGIKF